MRNKRDITINVIQGNVISNRKLAEYFARKYENRMGEIGETKVKKS